MTSWGDASKLTNPLTKEWKTAYKNVGNITKTEMTYPNNPSDPIVREFDRLGRLTEIDYNDLSNTPTVQFGYDVAGYRTQMSEIGSGSVAIRKTNYVYDAVGRLASIGFDTDASGGDDDTVSYAYDLAGNRTNLSIPTSGDITYTYDNKGQLISMTDWDGQETTFQHDQAGRHISTQRDNGFYTQYSYSPMGYLQELRNGTDWDVIKALESYILYHQCAGQPHTGTRNWLACYGGYSD